MTFGCFAGYGGWNCSLLWIVMILIFFIAAILRRQINDFLGLDFSVIGATILSEIIFILMMYITHSFKWGFGLGLIGILIGGFLSAPFLPDGSSGEGGEGWY